MPLIESYYGGGGDSYLWSDGERRKIGRASSEVDYYMSKDDIERCSPSRKDGINAMYEKHLRYSYCGFVQNLGLRLRLPQTTIGTAMILCHRFFIRRSHASHDRFVSHWISTVTQALIGACVCLLQLIATASVFLAGKSEESPQMLADVLRASSEILHNQDYCILMVVLPVDWFDLFRQRILEAETLILTTLNFELDVQHPYAPLTRTLAKLGLSQHTVLVTVALQLISEGLRSSLWLQFRARHIAAGAAYLAARLLNLEGLTPLHAPLFCHEFRTTPVILQDVVQQLMELF